MKTVEEVLWRCDYLARVNQVGNEQRRRISAIMDGGQKALEALLPDIDAGMADFPAANLMLSGVTRLGQKLGRLPDLRIDPPHKTDSQASRKRAEKLERIMAAHDEASWLDMAMPQLGRWLPGYGFGVFIIRERVSPDGFRYPHTELRDPLDCYPGTFGVDHQPDDICFRRLIEPRDLVRMYPDKATQITGRYGPSQGEVLDGVGSALGGSTRGSSWGSRGGMEVVEYYDSDGCWWVLPERNLLLDFIPNVLESGPQFVMGKRFAFNNMVGQYDHVIGLMAQMAKQNLLAEIATEDNVFAETNIVGDGPAGEYHRGRFALNVFPPGTQINKLQSNLPYQMFQQIDRLERQLRITAGYPVTDDAQSPNSFVTGQGLQELTSAIGAEVAEYQTVIKRMLQLRDSKVLEWDEKAYGKTTKPLHGVRKGEPFSETYTPATDIKGHYRTRRVYGAMATMDEGSKIVSLLQLLQGRLISTQTAQENLDGLESVLQEQERIRDEQAEAAVFQALLAQANEGEPRALMAAIEMLPQGDLRNTLQKFFTPEKPEMSEEEMAMAGMTQDPMAALAAGGGPPPDVATVLSQLSGTGSTKAGVQTVGSLPGRVA